MIKQPTIFAEASSSNHDGELAVVFDALPFFETATDEQLLTLLAQGNKRDSTEVLHALTRLIPEFGLFLELVQADEPEEPFDLNIDAADAENWLRANRPKVLEQLEDNHA